MPDNKHYVTGLLSSNLLFPSVGVLGAFLFILLILLAWRMGIGWCVLLYNSLIYLMPQKYPSRNFLGFFSEFLRSRPMPSQTNVTTVPSPFLCQSPPLPTGASFAEWSFPHNDKLVTLQLLRRFQGYIQALTGRWQGRKCMGVPISLFLWGVI